MQQWVEDAEEIRALAAQMQNHVPEYAVSLNRPLRRAFLAQDADGMPDVPNGLPDEIERHPVVARFRGELAAAEAASAQLEWRVEAEHLRRALTMVADVARTSLAICRRFGQQASFSLVDYVDESREEVWPLSSWTGASAALGRWLRLHAFCPEENPALVLEQAVQVSGRHGRRLLEQMFERAQERRGLLGDVFGYLEKHPRTQRPRIWAAIGGGGSLGPGLLADAADLGLVVIEYEGDDVLVSLPSTRLQRVMNLSCDRVVPAAFVPRVCHSAQDPSKRVADEAVAVRAS